eukprot:10163906-Heterocapsa_arctica.AAC.1
MTILSYIDGCYTEHAIRGKTDHDYYEQKDLDKNEERYCDEQHSNELVRMIRPDTWYNIQ